jgi:hypothetical protein
VTLSDAFAAHSVVYLQSDSVISLLSVDALDSLLSSRSFLVDNQDVLLRLLVPFEHPNLLRHIQWEFESTAAIASLCECLTESLWLAVADRVMHPPGFDFLIVSEFPSMSESSACSNGCYYGEAVATVPSLRSSTAVVIGTRTL